MKSVSAKFFCIVMSFVALFAPSEKMFGQDARQMFEIWQKTHVSRIAPSQVKHADLEKYLADLRKKGLKISEVGRSFGNRAIYQMEFGRGAKKVFLWSQMHGDEPTATSALIDLFDYLQTHRGEKWVKNIEENLTLRAVPMLNPDGAELYQRRNLQDIDINRDARNLQTPEGRLLKKLRDEWSPDLGFNLHNQNPRYSVGTSGRQAAVSFLAVASDEAQTDTDGRILAKRLIVEMNDALEKFISGHIARYDATFSPRAFGDNISKWGTQVILIETGGLRGKTEFDLVQLNFVALFTALKSYADGSETRADARRYDLIPENHGELIYDYIFRSANVVDVSRSSKGKISAFSADLVINVERRTANAPRSVILEIGDMKPFFGIEEFDAGDFYVVAKDSAKIKLGTGAELLFYRKSRAADIDFSAPKFYENFPPDLIFSGGKLNK